MRDSRFDAGDGACSAHLNRIAGRLVAAEQALAEEIAATLGVSASSAAILARLRIDEIVEARSADQAVHAAGDEVLSYCERCWALLRPDTPHVSDGEPDFFETCIYCGGPAHSEDAWERTA